MKDEVIADPISGFLSTNRCHSRWQDLRKFLVDEYVEVRNSVIVAGTGDA